MIIDGMKEEMSTFLEGNGETRITVFTPTYNRSQTLSRLFESLLRQDFVKFEWLIVDDGSQDNTECVVQRFIESPRRFFPIIYKKTKNGGKHRAINLGVSMANGVLFFIVDSDDYLTDCALAEVDLVERSIPSEAKRLFAGVCGNRGFTTNTPIGTTQREKGYLDITTLEREKYNITGDKSEVFYTSILKRYPFPEFEGENFLTEAVVWNQIAGDGLKLRFFNNINYITEYREDGLTKLGIKAFIESPKGWGVWIRSLCLYRHLSNLEKKYLYFGYYRHLRKKLRFSEIANNLRISSLMLWWDIITLSPHLISKGIKRLLKKFRTSATVS